MADLQLWGERGPCRDDMQGGKALELLGGTGWFGSGELYCDQRGNRGMQRETEQGMRAAWKLSTM